MLRSVKVPDHALAALALALVAGCTAPPSPETPAGFFFPRHDSPLGEGDAALLEGVVRMPGSCLLIVAEDGTVWLPIWPSDVVIGRLNSQPAVMAPDGVSMLLEVGDAFPDDVYQLGGSEVDPSDQELIGPVPDTCEFDRYWAVSDVLNPTGGQPTD
jgi:hypothetical protein